MNAENPVADKHSMGGQKFNIRIDRKEYEWTEKVITGAEIRRLPTTPIPAERDLFQVVPGHSDRKLDDDDKVTAHDGLRIFTAPSTINPGTTVDFQATAQHPPMLLPRSDIEYLTEQGVPHQIEAESDMVCVVIPQWPLPDRLDRGSADLLVRLSPGYPDVPPEMWWFSPAVHLANGTDLPGTDVVERHLNRHWQRWSRHLNDGQWKPGIDGLESYLTLIRQDIQQGAPKVA